MKSLAFPNMAGKENANRSGCELARHSKQDGSINLLLRALPMPDANTGAALLQLRPPRPDSEAIREDEAAFYLEIDPIMGAPIEEL